MMVTFTCKADSSITIPKRDAIFLLDVMGQSEDVPGSLLEGDVSAAIERLKAALDEAVAQGDGVREERLKALEPIARSLVTLLEAAERAPCNVTWFDATDLV